MPSRSALADRSDLPVMLITRLSNADKKNRPGRSPTICRRFAELSDLRESKWDPEISWEIPPRYWKVFSKNRNNFRKESFSPNLIDNQSSLYITKLQLWGTIIQHTGTIVVPQAAYSHKGCGFDSKWRCGIFPPLAEDALYFWLSKLHICKKKL